MLELTYPLNFYAAIKCPFIEWMYTRGGIFIIIPQLIKVANQPIRAPKYFGKDTVD